MCKYVLNHTTSAHVICASMYPITLLVLTLYVQDELNNSFLLATSFIDSPDTLKLRLVEGSTPREGRVEIYFGDSWGSICDDNWDLTDASIVCRQLGLGFAVEAVVKDGNAPPRFGEGKNSRHPLGVVFQMVIHSRRQWTNLDG